jgi:hypothetical protein
MSLPALRHMLPCHTRTTGDGERGQMLIVFAFVIVPASFVIAAVVIDASIWQSERTGAQKDADLAALAGAYELLDQTAGESNTITAAQTATSQNADDNDEEDNAAIIDDVEVTHSCFNSEELDSVMVDISHDSQPFFSSIFGIELAPDIGAHARACMGSPIEGRGLLPLGVQVTGFDTECFEPSPSNPSGPEVPIFGQYCRLAFAGADLTSGEGGFLKLFNDGGTTCSAPNTGGGNMLQDEIEQGGANTTCYVAPPGASCDSVPADWPYGTVVNYCVWPKTQTFNNPTQDSFTDLLSGEGDCDALYGDNDGIDDWLEVVEAVNGDPSPSPETTFSVRDCDPSTDGPQRSPRVVDLIIIQEFDASGNQPRPILAFASFYIDACEIDGVQYRDCDVSGPMGQASLYGFFMNIMNVGSLGAYNGYGQRTIALWE